MGSCAEEGDGAMRLPLEVGRPIDTRGCSDFWSAVEQWLGILTEMQTAAVAKRMVVSGRPSDWSELEACLLDGQQPHDNRFDLP